MRRVVVSLLLLLLFSAPMLADGPEALLAEGRADEALALLKERVKQEPRDAGAWHLLSRAYFGMERWGDAVNAGEKAVSLEPGNARFHLWLGREYGEKAENSIFFTAIGLAKKTRAEFEKAVELQSNDLDAQSDLAEFFIEAPSFLGGGKDKAEAQAQKLASVDPATSHWIRARIAEKDSRPDEAELEYKAAIAASNNKAGYWLNLASFYRRTKRFAEMESAINKAVAANRSHDDVFYEGAELLFKAGRNFPVAAQFLRKYLSSNDKVEQAPTYQAHYLLGSILEKMGDRQAAAVEYRAALSLARDFGPAQDALRRLAP